MPKQVIVCGKLIIDGTSNPPLKDGAVLIKDGIIKAIDTKDKLTSTINNIEVIDFGNNVLLPGLIDSHNHLSLDCDIENYLDKMEESESELTIRALVTMAKDLKSGVTTSRCMGEKFFIDVACKKAVQEGRIFGPRLLVATRGIRSTHGHGVVGMAFDGPDAVLKAVRENIKAGADHIKFYVTSTAPQKGIIPSYLTVKEIQTIIFEAKSAGLKTAAHCVGGKALELCVNEGVDSIEHGYFLSDYEIEILANSKAWLVLTPSEYLTDKPNLPPNKMLIIRKFREKVWERMGAILQSGIKYAVGTDGMHGKLYQELQYIVGAGASENSALQAVTIDAAKLCGMDDSIGSIEKGKRGDILVVEGNPLENLKYLSQVVAVLKDGKIVYNKQKTVDKMD